jgi:NADH dehydrogenase/NADH:ubiquinone oxidoreductase subunit G
MPSPQVINHDALCKSTELRRCFELMLRDECSVGDWLTFFVKHSETVKVQARWSKVTVGTLKGMAKVLGVDANVRVRAQLLTLMTTKVVEMLNQHVEREEEQKQAADAKAAEEAVAEAAARARRKSSKKRKPEEKKGEDAEFSELSDGYSSASCSDSDDSSSSSSSSSYSSSSSSDDDDVELISEKSGKRKKSKAKKKKKKRKSRKKTKRLKIVPTGPVRVKAVPKSTVRLRQSLEGVFKQLTDKQQQAFLKSKYRGALEDLRIFQDPGSQSMSAATTTQPCSLLAFVDIWSCTRLCSPPTPARRRLFSTRLSIHTPLNSGE